MTKYFSWMMVSTFIVLPTTSRTQATVTLGMTRQAVHVLLGSPSEYWVRGVLLPIYPRGSENVMDAYPRHAGARRYELLVGYTVDMDASRLHPPIVVEEIRILADKPVSVRTMLGDSAEVGHLCRDGCDAFSKTFDAKLFEVVVRQKQPSGGRQLEIEFSAEAARTLEPLSVQTLDDLTTMAILTDVPPDAQNRTFDHLAKSGSWPEK